MEPLTTSIAIGDVGACPCTDTVPISAGPALSARRSYEYTVWRDIEPLTMEIWDDVDGPPTTRRFFSGGNPASRLAASPSITMESVSTSSTPIFFASTSVLIEPD